MKINLKLIKSFDRAAALYDKANVIPMEVAARLFERLQVFHFQPQVIVDLGSATGNCLPYLYKKYRGANIIAVDLSLQMLKKARKKIPWHKRKGLVCATADVLPLAQNSVDAIFSNLMFHWCDDLEVLFAELYRILRPGGLLMFTMYGPGTLIELQQAWSQVDNYSHINVQTDLHEVGDSLLKASFADPVLDQEKIMMSYSDVALILSDLKALGSYNLTKQRCLGLWGKAKMQQLIDCYQAYSQPNGKLPVSYEVIYGHAWKSAKLENDNQQGREVRIDISQISRKKGHEP